MTLSSSTCSSSLLSISTGCASSSFSCQGQDSRKAGNSLDTAKCLAKAHKHSMQGIGCQWNCPLPHVPPPCSQSQQAVAVLPPSPVRVRILEKPEIPLDTAKCLSKAHKHSMQGIGCQWNCPLPHVPPPCSQSQQAVPLPPSPVRVRILEKPEIL